MVKIGIHNLKTNNNKQKIKNNLLITIIKKINSLIKDQIQTNPNQIIKFNNNNNLKQTLKITINLKIPMKKIKDLLFYKFLQMKLERTSFKVITN